MAFFPWNGSLGYLEGAEQQNFSGMRTISRGILENHLLQLAGDDPQHAVVR